eukprot:Hpha_TRINITY_DN11161_c0_g1::TRINITY_DN11161_c0_g1_i1::g.28204::m.28204
MLSNPNSQVNVPVDWEVTEEDEGRTVRLLRGDEEEEALVVVFEHNRTGKAGAEEAERLAREGRAAVADEMALFGDVVQEQGGELLMGFEWELSVRLGTAEEHCDDVDLPPREPVHVWNCVCVRRDWVITFAMSRAHGFARSVREAREVVASIKFT